MNSVKQNFTVWGKFSWPLVVAAAAFLFAIGSGVNLLNDGDTFWHIATGRWILEHGAIPHADSFSHTLPGIAWTSHEWLSEVIFYLAFKTAGWTGVVLLAATVFAAVLAYLASYLQRYLEPAHVLLFSILALGMVAPHLLARPHLLAIPLLVIWTGSLIRACEEGHSPKLWLLLVMVVWANLHGGFTLGLALAAAFGVEAVLAAKKGERFQVGRRWATFLVLAVLAGLLTPHGVEGIFFTAKIMGMSYALTHIGEWQPPYFQRFQFLELWLMLLLLAVFTRGLRLSPVRLVLLLGLLHLALNHVRNVELLGLLAPLLLASAIKTQWTLNHDNGGNTKTLDAFFKRHAQPASLQAIVVVFFLVGATTYYKLQQQGIAPPEGRHPIAALQAVKESGIKGPVFNQYEFGGYLIFSGVPVFIDGRADMYGDDFFKHFLEASRFPHMHGLEELLAKYHVAWTILGPNTPAAAFLDHLPGWRRLYADNTAVVHVRDAAALTK